MQPIQPYSHTAIHAIHHTALYSLPLRSGSVVAAEAGARCSRGQYTTIHLPSSAEASRLPGAACRCCRGQEHERHLGIRGQGPGWGPLFLPCSRVLLTYHTIHTIPYSTGPALSRAALSRAALEPLDLSLLDLGTGPSCRHEGFAGGIEASHASRAS